MSIYKKSGIFARSGGGIINVIKIMKVSIINIGDELLIGQVVNSNAAEMARMLTGAGIDVAETLVVGDVAADIRAALERSLPVSDAVLLTGGLGPTRDDITKSVLCNYFGCGLREDAEALANVARLFAAKGYPLTEVNRQQALVPECCTVLNNDLGTAPCMWFDVEGAAPKAVVSMAGVPFEMRYLMEHKVVPLLCSRFAVGAIVCRNIIVQGIGESFLSDMIKPWELALPPSIKLAYLPEAGMVKLRLTMHGGNAGQLAAAVDELGKIAADYIVGTDAENVPEVVAREFRERGLTLATAESCTGGRIASLLTSMAGASDYFRGGVVAYSNDVKEAVLGVRHDTLAEHGAVSEATVRQMAEGVRRITGSDYAVATTGVAGPGGGTPDKPVGTVWIGGASAQGTTAKLVRYGDRREQNIARTCNEALATLVRIVRNCFEFIQ